MADTTVMTVTEVAAYLKLNPQTVMRMAARGDLPAIKVGKEWRFKKEHIDAKFDEDARKKLCGEQSPA